MTTEQRIIEMYVEENKSTYEISKILGTYPNKIRRILLKNGIAMKDKSVAQKNAIKSGVTKLPTNGTKRTIEDKIKISSGLKKSWASLNEDNYKKRVESSRSRWQLMSEEEKQNMKRAATNAIRKAGKNGSKLEIFIRQELSKEGYRVEPHKKNLLPNENLEIDMYLPDFKAIIEIDGPSHFLPIWGWEKLNKQIKADENKTGLILSKGFVIIRVKNMRGTLAMADSYYLKDKLLSILSDIKVNFPIKSKRYIEVEI